MSNPTEVKDEKNDADEVRKRALLVKAEEDRLDQNAIINTKFLGKVESWQKIYLTPTLELRSDSLTNSISRSLFGSDSRDSTLSFSKYTITRVLEILERKYYSDLPSDKDLVKSLKADLKKAKEGLDNLCITYGTDVKFSCEVRLLCETITRKILDLDIKLTGSYESESDEGDEGDEQPELEEISPNSVTKPVDIPVKPPVNSIPPAKLILPGTQPAKTFSQVLRSQKLAERRLAKKL